MASLFEIVAGHADADPQRLALISEMDGTRTYGELVERSAALGFGLRDELGLRAGERICIWGVNRPEWLETVLAAGAIGASIVAANPEWTDAETRWVLVHSEVAAVVCDPDLAARALDLAAGLGSLRHVVAIEADGVAIPSGAHSYATLLVSGHEGERPSPSEKAGEGGEAASFIMYTSGTTTGRPKAVVMSPGSATATIDYVDMFGLRSVDRAILVTPFFHGNGFGGLATAVAHGASVVFPRRFSASRFWGLVDRYRPTYLWTLVPLVNILLGQPPGLHERTHAFRVLIVLGSGPAAPVIEERFATPVIDWYGMTEAGTGTFTRLNEPRKPGSAGRPFPGAGMLIVRPDGTEAAPGEQGEVVFRLDAISFNGYLKDPEATSAALDGEYFHTGDIGYFDEEGYFFFLDRKKDIVRRGGENISSLEVELILRSHGAVADAAVVGKPDPVLGERVVAFVVSASNGGQSPEVAAIQRHVGDHLAQFKVPEEIIFVEELPRTPTGKVEKFRLRQRLTSPVP